MYGDSMEKQTPIIITTLILSTTPLLAEVSSKVNNTIFDRACVPCHQHLPTSLQQIFKRYLLNYSGEENVKVTMMYYLKHPSKELSVMSDLFLDTYGIKKATTLSDKALTQSIQTYWERYKVFGRLK